jgi:hypothetical protein
MYTLANQREPVQRQSTRVRSLERGGQEPSADTSKQAYGKVLEHGVRRHVTDKHPIPLYTVPTYLPTYLPR